MSRLIEALKDFEDKHQGIKGAIRLVWDGRKFTGIKKETQEFEKL